MIKHKVQLALHNSRQTSRTRVRSHGRGYFILRVINYVIDHQYAHIGGRKDIENADNQLKKSEWQNDF